MNYSTHQEINELKGHMSLTFEQDKSFEGFCERNFPNYKSSRYEAIALRVFYGKELVVTLYAVDRDRRDRNESEKLPVKKFKTSGLSLAGVLPFIKELNFTLTTGAPGSDDIEVINK
ncbi:MAG: hypothetical protein WAQ28_02505 [Bacteroidia bacterium]|jgi:hypothetical protein